MEEKEAIIEALLFAYGDKVELNKIAEIIELDIPTTKTIIDGMIINYKNSIKGFFIQEIENGYQMATKSKYYDYVKKLYDPKHKQGLSQAAYETLAIIAYNQPITRAKIEYIRGVNSDSAVFRLLEKNLIEDAGKLDTPGKPTIYKTTEEFLKSFGFKSLNDLPNLETRESPEADIVKEEV